MTDFASNLVGAAIAGGAGVLGKLAWKPVSEKVTALYADTNWQAWVVPGAVALTVGLVVAFAPPWVGGALAGVAAGALTAAAIS